MSDSRQRTDPIERWEDEGGATTSGAFGTSGERRENHETRSQRRGSGGGSEEAGSTTGGALPSEIADRFTQPLARFFKIEVAAAITLLLATIAALVLSNSGWATPFAAFWVSQTGV